MNLCSHLSVVDRQMPKNIERPFLDMLPSQAIT